MTADSPKSETALGILRVMEQIMAGLPPGAAKLSVERTTSRVIARIEPSNPAAAHITVHVESGVPMIDVTLGQGGFFEVSAEHTRFSDLEEPLDEVRALCLAAINGKYKEKVRLKGDEVVSSHGIVQIGSREEPVHWRQLFTNPLRRSMRRAFSYEPYEDGLD
jgi:hypothetical protein